MPNELAASRRETHHFGRNSLELLVAGSAEARSATVGGYQALVRQARGQARLQQPHQTVAVLEALAAGAAAVNGSTAGASTSSLAFA